MRFRNLKIGQKLLVINLISTLVVVLFAGGYWALRNTADYRTYFDARIHSQVNLVGRNSSAAVMFNDWEEVGVILNALSADEAILSANITKYSSGRVQSITFRDQKPFLTVPTFWSQGEQYGIKTLEVPIWASDAEIAKLGVVYHDLSVKRTMSQAGLTLFLVCLASLLMASLLSIRLQGIVTKPILQLTDLARKVTETENYALRSPRYYPDEIGALTKDFNTMLSIIELRDHSLEAQVQRRSSELAQRNTQLEQQIRQREDADKARKITEAGFEQVFLSAPIGMALLGANRLVMRSNDEFQKVLGLSRDSRILFDECIEAGYLDGLRQAFSELVSGVIDDFEQALDCFGKDAEPLKVSIRCSAVRDSHMKFRYAVLQLQDETESRKLAASLEYQARHDALTGLENRWVLNQALADTFNENNKAIHTLCVLDLDQFKVVNDTCGHLAGDELLQQIASLIKATVPDNLVVRLGGDEFAILLSDCDAAAAKIYTERVRCAIENIEFYWDHQRFRIGASIGAVSTAKLSPDITALMQQADAACFVAKEQGRNRTHIIDGDDSDVLQHQGEMRWLQRIHAAIEGDLFELFIQPVKNLRHGLKGRCYEVLLRLKESSAGTYIYPESFLSAAERYGLSVLIDRWVIENLIRTLQQHPELITRDTEYWVNLSGISLGDGPFLSELEELIAKAGIAGGVINFEITETAVIRNVAESRVAMNRLKLLGCRFALDDFGTGTASFAYLKQLPVDIIKIDGVFVKDILNDEIDHIFVKSIIDIARVMGIKTVAEYVETKAILKEIELLEADYAQGYAIGRPKPLLSIIEQV